MNKIIYLGLLLLSFSTAQAADTVTGTGTSRQVTNDAGCAANPSISTSIANEAETLADQNAAETCAALGFEGTVVRISDYTHLSGCKRYGPWYSLNQYSARASAVYSCNE